MNGLPVTREDLRGTVRGVVGGFERHELLTYASAISYQVLAALIPFACFALGLLGMLNLETLWRDHLAPQIQRRTSGAVYTVIDQTVTNVLAHQQVFWVTAGLLLALWEVSGAVRAVMSALDEIYETPRRRRWIQRVVTSMWLAAACAALILAAFTAKQLLPFGLGWLAAATLTALAVGLLVRFAPEGRQPLPWVSFGTLLVVVGWLVSWLLYVLYVTQVADYSTVFGSLSAVFVLFFFVYLSATVFLVGLLVDANLRREVREP
jgi:membrane protein